MARTILVIDDDSDVLFLIQATLETEGYDILCASGPEEARALLERGRPDLVITDLMMPGEGGLGIIAHIRNTPVLQDLPVLAVSILGAESRALAAGATAYLTKPFETGEMVSVVTSLVGRG